ncbi:hypothetical protein L3Q82_013730 [Scortum barcoo]|uniref:Uncharacterized protein n=1 Tax=Scortum barcoo TaxID=214431 RepID=A0ACB8W1H4_9TELE|nr:hypothetical protein L3Q82_013730 [Scortum barcoo]
MIREHESERYLGVMINPRKGIIMPPIQKMGLQPWAILTAGCLGLLIGPRYLSPNTEYQSDGIQVNRRTTDPLDCPLCEKKLLTHLDKHLLETHGLTALEEREPLIRHAKKLAIAREFSWMRACNPQEPLVSTLRLCSLDEGPLGQLPGEESPGCDGSGPSGHQCKCVELERRVEALEAVAECGDTLATIHGEGGAHG